MFFNYRIGGTVFDAPPVSGTTDNNVDTPAFVANNVPALNFSSPIISGTSGPLVGSSASASLAKSSSVSLLVAKGSNLWVRFFDPNNAGNDNGMAVDDFQLSYTTTVLPGTDSVITNTGSTSYSVGRVMVSSTLNNTLHKTGTQQTSYSMTPSAGSNLSAAGGVFDVNAQDGSVTIGYAAPGLVNGTISVHNEATGRPARDREPQTRTIPSASMPMPLTIARFWAAQIGWNSDQYVHKWHGYAGYNRQRHRCYPRHSSSKLHRGQLWPWRCRNNRGGDRR